MTAALFLNEPVEKTTVQITGSKSESNRLLILQQLFPNLSIENLSESDDSKVLQKALQSSEGVIDIHHAGTAMRFLTAYFATKEGKKVTLTGSQRMKERPIGILVEALQQLGANIQYTDREGYPPLQIEGQKLDKNKVSLQANISSQFITALMLVAPSFPKGLTISLLGKLTSVPYIKMTASLLKEAGVVCRFSENFGTGENNTIAIDPVSKIASTTFVVESDWSSASYFYSLVALSKNLKVTLKAYKKNSLQGDAEVATIYQKLGVETQYNSEENSIHLSKINTLVEHLEVDLNKTPDIAQTIAVTCFGLNVSCNLTGLHTLKIKETDRLVALKTELEKMGASVQISEDSLQLQKHSNIVENVSIATYNDHRMAMAFAPLALRIPLKIEDYKVVSKSYPSFWDDMQKVGIGVKLK